LLIELIAWALLFGALLGAMISRQIGLLNGLLGTMLSVPAILGLHGYYVSRFLATVAWASKTKGLYPTIASIAFVAHVLYIASRWKSDFTSQTQPMIIPFLIGGAGIVFACAFAGNLLFNQWSRATSRVPLLSRE
jgi:hypothetical protein